MEKGYALGVWGRGWPEDLWPAANLEKLSKFLRLSSELCQKAPDGVRAEVLANGGL